jgi:hypothetical protein
MSENIAPNTDKEIESLKKAYHRAEDRYSDLEKRISEYIDLLEPLEIRKDLQNDWEEVVKNNQDDDYSKAWLDYMVHWAKLMQNLIKNRVILTEKIIDETSFLADTYGITGFMHNAAVATLKKYWKHGDVFETGTKNAPSDALSRLEGYAASLEKAGMVGYANSIRDCVKELRWETR